MDIDPNQPWGIAVDYAGRATLQEAGHTVTLRITDSGLNSDVLVVDSITGQYPTVYVTAQITENGDANAQLHGWGQVPVAPVGTAIAVPDPNAVVSAVAAALADFDARTTAYAALCTTWAPTSGDSGSGDTGSGTGGDTGTGTDPGSGDSTGGDDTGGDDTGGGTGTDPGTGETGDAGTGTSDDIGGGTGDGSTGTDPGTGTGA
jgi:hypothetical protein